MKIAFLMDPLESMKIEKDTSYALIRAAISQSHEVYHFELNDISVNQNRLLGRLTSLQRLKADQHFERGEIQVLPLEEMDAIFIRKDPPFDRRYFYATLLLDMLPTKTLVLNNPSALRDWNEKLSSLGFQNRIPKTLISSRTQEIIEFVSTLEKSVLKPLDGFGGKGISFVSKETKDLRKIVEKLTHQQSRWIVVNEFVKEASEGDKRVLLVDGEPIGAILRKSESGLLHNLDQGARALEADLTETDRKICEELKPFLLENGLFFVGIDLLGPKLTEINVTSPTGLQELMRFSKIDHARNIIAQIEERVKNEKREGNA